MKSSFILSATAILPLMGLLTLSACQGVIFPEDEYTGIPAHQLTVQTRSTEPLSSLPVQVFAFDTEGRLLGAQRAASLQDDLSLTLPPGKCRIVAASGYDVGDSPSLQDVMSMPETNYSTSPMLLGLADVTMGDKPQSLNLLLAHRVAQLQMSLRDVPAEVTGVQVSVSSPFSRINLQGELSEPRTAEIPCVQDNSEWTTGSVYVLPTAQNAVFSIRLSFSDHEECYGYTFSGVLSANTPYILYGTYADGVNLQGGFIRQEWESTVETFFDFGPGVQSLPVNQPGEDEVVLVDEIPEPGTLWNGHVVADVTETDGGAQLLLLGLREWNGLTSALCEENPDVAMNLAREYVENGMNGWRIPTKEEAQGMMRQSTDLMAVLNTLITSADGDPMLAIDEKQSTIRYLCEDATSSFALVPGSKVSKAGVKLNTYHLRLVKSVSVAVP